ncbi:MAG: hypothetical protein M0T84_01580 [Betaproteobacteria bacterium]|nr:hypothetical protein [Betaproteobacteria bacterium]
MNAQNEIAALKKQGAILKYATLSVAAIGIIGAVFMIGGREGYGYAIHKIRDAVQASQYPTVFLTYPGKQPAAIVVNGVCKPYPAVVPQFYHFGGYVSPRWVPCSGQNYTKSTAVSPALAAIESHTK